MKNNGNIYVPSKTMIQKVTPLTPDVNLYTLKTSNRPNWKPGQFFMVSVFGSGEVPISVASSPDEPLMLCIREVGSVTSAIHDLKAGDVLGLRGPYGNGFPFDSSMGRDVVVLAGGLGIVPLRPLLQSFIKNRNQYGSIFLLYGAKRPDEILFREDASLWEEAGIRITHSVDCPEGDWKGCTGVVTSHLEKADTNFSEATAFVCGPQVMIDAAMRELSAKGLPDERIITTLEAHMKCGVGKCGHCYKGAGYICTSGPVFTLKEIEDLEMHGMLPYGL
jgi:NAD(P)H-flavin reductase